MKNIIDTNRLQPVINVKDNTLYVYKTQENPYFLEEEYTLIQCYLVRSGRPDFTKAMHFYGKDLVRPEEGHTYLKNSPLTFHSI